jgi:hypothetical protein
MNTTERPTPRTNAAFDAFSRGACGTAYLCAKMAELERELAHANQETAFYSDACDRNAELHKEAQAKLSTVYQWIERNHPDGFIDSLTHLQNLERVTEANHDRLDAVEREIKAMRAAIQETLMENLHLADGDVCTLKRLKDAIGFSLPKTPCQPSK